MVNLKAKATGATFMNNTSCSPALGDGCGDSLIDAIDTVGTVRSLVEAIWMAAGRLERKQAGAIHAICDHADNLIKAAIGMIERAREEEKAWTSGADVGRDPDLLRCAIERHRAAQEAHDAAPDHSDETLCPLSEAEDEACDKLTETPCANDAEFLEKLRYLLARETRLFGKPTIGTEYGSVVRATALHFEQGSKGVQCAAVGAEVVDAGLIHLGEELEASWQTEEALSDASADDLEAALDRSKKIVDAICKMPATSLEGLRIKSRAVLWCHCGEFEGFGGTTDEKLAASIVRDLLVL